MIAIIGVLAAIIIPVTGKVRANARNAQCQSNLRQIGQYMQLYLTDNGGVFPQAFDTGSISWDYKLVSYAYGPEAALAAGQAAGTPLGVFSCPSSKKPTRDRQVASSYAINLNLVGSGNSPASITPRMNIIRNPSETYLITDSDGREFWRDSRARFLEVRYDDTSAVDRHRGRINMLFVDGSVRPLDFNSMPWGSSHSSASAPWGPN